MRRALHQLPNFISILRMLLVVPIGWYLWHLELRITLMLVALAGASDLLDGFLAKHYRWQSRLGAVLDPSADKLLIVTLFVILSLLHWVPLWLTIAVLAREIVLISGAIGYRLWFGPVDIRPSLVSKLNTLLEVLYIFSVIAHEAFGQPSRAVLMGLGAITFGTVVVSGIDYVLRYGQRGLTRGRATWPSTAGSKLP